MNKRIQPRRLRMLLTGLNGLERWIFTFETTADIVSAYSSASEEGRAIEETIR